ncbi:MAG: DNA polymerase III subunit gamma/tau, partial [Acidobacteriota bacterium]|nr:DNA polymerase III subunit gamma/tau [Acidobacteriota bacterium]
MSTGPSRYRRHRPRTFADVVGQEHVVRTLRNAVEQGQVHHAYLFVGSRGTGKTSMAKILAACLNCVNGPTVTPCGTCDSCVSIASATSLDVIEMDAASNNSVDDIRELREKVAYAPVSGRHKVYILDEAHMLSTQAWNAFLKTLEEPPPRTVFVLATTEAQKVLPTVVDRCHRFDFGRPTAEQVATVVRRVAAAESIAIEDGAAGLIARHATGSFRDALGTLEQLVSYAGDAAITPQDVLTVLGVADGEQLFAAVDAIVARDPAAALRTATALASSGRDPGQVLRDLEVHARELLTVQILGEVPAELRVTAERDQRLVQQAKTLAETDAVRLLGLVSAALDASANGAQPLIQLELLLIKAAAPEMDPSVAALLARIERLERGGVRPVTRSPAPTPEAPETPEREPAAVETAEGSAAEPFSASVPDPTDPPAPDELAETAISLAVSADPSGSGQANHTTATEVSDMQRMWPAVVELVRGGNAMLGVLLESARPSTVSERELVLSFPPEAAFYKRKAEQDDYRRTTAEAVRNVTGMALTLRYEL